jgi:pilus assembly protein CpaE
VIISPDRQLREGVERGIAASDKVVLLKSYEHYLRLEELEGVQRAHAPQVVFFDAATAPERISILPELARQLPYAQVVALSHGAEPATLMRLMQAGVRELLCPPFPAAVFDETMARIEQVVRETPTPRESTDLVFAFLPAKAGAGASILAANVAHALSRSLAGKVLLADFDMQEGVSRFLMKLTGPFSARDALERAGSLDDGVWGDLISPAGGIDVLPSGPIQRSFHFAEGAVRRLVEFSARKYKSVCVDLSGGFDPFVIELLPECKRILLVVQPDLPTVYLAREKVAFLRSMDLEERVGIILNRWHREACLTIADIESALGLPIEDTVADSPAAVYRAMLNAAPVEPASDLGRELAGLAVRLAEAKTEKAGATPKRRMVEYFNVLPARYSLFR